MKRKLALTTAAALLAISGTATAEVINIADALGNTGNYSENTDISDVAAVDDILGEESVYLVGTIEVSNPSDVYQFGTLYFGIETGSPTGSQRIGMGNTINSNDWGVNGAGNIASGIDAVLDTPTVMVLKLNQVTGDWTFWLSPNLGAPEPGLSTLTGNDANILEGIGRIRLRGGAYAGLTNTNIIDYTDVALYTGSDTPFVPEPTSLALLGLGGLLVARRRRA